MWSMKNPILIAALASAAVALGACGSDDDGSSGGQPQDKAYAGALKFAKCMRDEGIDMPDPQRQANGGILQRMGSEDQPVNEAKVEAAQKACRHFMDVGGGAIERDPAKEAEHRDALLAYAKCMRRHGIAMPDPEFSADGRVTMKLGGPGKGEQGPRPESAPFKAADQACRPALAKVEGDAGPGASLGTAQEAKP